MARQQHPMIPSNFFMEPSFMVFGHKMPARDYMASHPDGKGLVQELSMGSPFRDRALAMTRSQNGKPGGAAESRGRQEPAGWRLA
jgi:hypothetical protein